MIARGRNRFATLRQNDLIAARSTITANLGKKPRFGEFNLREEPRSRRFARITVSLFGPGAHRRGWRGWFCPAPGRLVTEHEIGRLNAALVLLERDEERVQSARGKKRSFDGPGRFAREHHLF